MFKIVSRISLPSFFFITFATKKQAKPIEKYILSYQSIRQSSIAKLEERYILTDTIWQSVIAKSNNKESEDIQISNGPSILIPRKGSLNNIIYSPSPFWTVDTMFWTQIKSNIVTPLFLYYSICKKDFASLNVGTAVPSLTVPVIEDVKISLPNIKTQLKICSILKSIDDKIKLNCKINSNLEEQAKALFKSWFIDFEPFKGGKFVDSELGKIPEGWEVGRYDDIVSATVAGDWGKDKPIGNYVH